MGLPPLSPLAPKPSPLCQALMSAQVPAPVPSVSSRPPSQEAGVGEGGAQPPPQVKGGDGDDLATQIALRVAQGASTALETAGSAAADVAAKSLAAAREVAGRAYAQAMQFAAWALATPLMQGNINMGVGAVVQQVEDISLDPAEAQCQQGIAGLE